MLPCLMGITQWEKIKRWKQNINKWRVRGISYQPEWGNELTEQNKAKSQQHHLQKLTDLNASPGMSRTVPETSAQLCTPGWSRVLGEKMLSGKTLSSVLGKQRQTQDRESQEGWMQINP